MQYTTSTGNTHEIPTWVIEFDMIETHCEYLEASDKCDEAFAPLKQQAPTEEPKAELNEWVHPRTGQVRRYINNVDELIGLETSHYNTGNISGAWLDGEIIANRQAGMILSLIDSMKLWLDDNGVLHWYKASTSSRYIDADDIVDAVRAAL